MDSFWASRVFVKLFYTRDLVMELHCFFHFFPLYYDTKLNFVKHLKQKNLDKKLTFKAWVFWHLRILSLQMAVILIQTFSNPNAFGKLLLVEIYKLLNPS